MLSDLLSDKEINLGKQLEFDIAKAILIILLVYCHVYESCCFVSVSQSPWLFFGIRIIGGPFGAPLFMIAMGLGLAYTRHNKSKDFINRGLFILVLGFILNFLRGSYAGFISYIIYNNQYYLDLAINYLLNGDILIFAGLALTLFGLLKKYKLTYKQIFTFALILAIIGSILPLMRIDFGNNVLNLIFGLFIPNPITREYSTFPLFTWFMFPILGYGFAKLIRRTKDKNKLYLKILPYLLVFIIIYSIIAYFTGYGIYNGDLSQFYHMDIIGIFYCFACSIVLLAFYNYISKFIPKKILPTINFLSRNITIMYVIQWLITGNTQLIMMIFSYEGFNILEMFMYGTFVLVITLIITIIYNKIKAKHNLSPSSIKFVN